MRSSSEKVKRQISYKTHEQLRKNSGKVTSIKLLLVRHLTTMASKLQQGLIIFIETNCLEVRRPLLSFPLFFNNGKHVLLLLSLQRNFLANYRNTYPTFFKRWLFSSKKHGLVICRSPEEYSIAVFHVLRPRLKEILHFLQQQNNCTGQNSNSLYCHFRLSMSVLKISCTLWTSLLQRQILIS